MTRPRTAQARKRAAGVCRNRRRPQGERRPEWVRSFRRAQRALDASLRLIISTERAVDVSERIAVRRPIRASGSLQEVEDLLVRASEWLGRAWQEMAATAECIARDPECADDVPELMMRETQRWVAVAGHLTSIASYVFALHRDVLHGLAVGELVPEVVDRRPRIILKPRPVAMRAFLLWRQPRVRDRIASLLLRRRRIRRPGAVDAPRRISRGRAPPVVSLCPL